MSSALKDTRWQLATGYAEEDRVEWDSISHEARGAYLDTAQQFLDRHGTHSIIEALASAFRAGA